VLFIHEQAVVEWDPGIDAFASGIFRMTTPKELSGFLS